MWKPKDFIEKNEHIGRRLFRRRKPLKGAQGQTPPPESYELYHFEESEPDVSVDRLGATGVDKKVKNYLNDRGHHASTKFEGETPFLGWAVAKAQDFQKPFKGDPIEVLASPIKSQLVEDDAVRNDLEANDYHADLNRPANHDSLYMAFRLQSIFERNYRMEPCIEQRNTSVNKNLKWYQRLKFWLDDMRHSR